MRRVIFSLICSSGNAANVLKPTSVGITSSQSESLLGRPREFASPRFGDQLSYDLRHPACTEKYAAGGCLPAATNEGHLSLRTGRMSRSVLKCSLSGGLV